MSNDGKHLIALLTNNDDDIYCFRRELIQAFISQGYSVLISCPDGPKFELMKDIEYIYDNPDIDRRGTNIVADYKLYKHYKALFKKYRPDVVLTYTAKPNVYGGAAAYSLKIPYICNVTGLGSVIKKSLPVRTVILKMFAYSYRRASCVMFQNETNMNTAIKNGMVKGEYKLLPGSGVNTERYPLQPYPEGGNGIEGKTVIFNYIGRVLADKGIDDYIELAKRIKSEYPETEFNILGFIEPTESHYETELKLLGEANTVNYRGSLKDIKPYLARAHATIHPSTYGEGMSNVLLESASCGRVLITTDNPGCKETVIDNKSGYIYHGGDVDELYAKTVKFLETDNVARCEMGKVGREYVRKNFSRDIVIERYIESIKKLINKD